MTRYICLLFALALAVAQAAERHVILVTIDGFPGRTLEDKKALIPNIRALEAEGASARGMKVSTPSVTWPNHTTLITGVHPRKHTVLFNGLLTHGSASPVAPAIRPNGLDPLIRKYDADNLPVGSMQARVDPNATAAELVAVPTLFDVFHAAGLKTAGVNWPCTRSSKSLDDDLPDSPNTLNFTTPRLRSELAAAGVLASEQQADFASLGQPQRDDVWTKTACYLVKNRMPHFMAFHLLNTDSTHHKYGSETMAGYTALAMADRFVGDLVAAVNTSGKRAQTTFIITSDHGFATATNLIQPNIAFRQAGLLELTNRNAIGSARVQCISEGGSGFIYLNNPATRDEDRKRAIEILSGLEGVAEVIGAERFAEIGIPDAGKNGSPHLILRARIGYGVGGAASGDATVIPITPALSSGYHGYVADEPLMNALFVASGRGIKKGARLEQTENIHVAPTIARLLGVALPSADGKAIAEILD